MSGKPSLKIINLGCSKNVVDSEHLLYQIREKYDIKGEGEILPYLDYVLINTCSFIGDAMEESIDEIFRQVALKNEGKIGKLVVFGCLSQRFAADMPKLIPEVDAWFGARTTDDIVAYLGCEPKEVPMRVLGNNKSAYAYLKISEGCNRRCSYCAIPLIRGNYRSVPEEHLVEEARFLAGKGVKELILIAQDTTAYGIDLYGRRTLAHLLEELSKIEGIEWIRIHYSYPVDFPKDVLDQMANNPKVCRYIDIPLQHISDKVLGNMRRGHDSAGTRKLIAEIKEKVPGVAIRSTFIVGHPGEGPKEFKELLQFIGEYRLDRVGAFKYSHEQGTYGGENFKDSVSKATKQRRLDAFMTLQGEISQDENLKRVGSVEKVLVDDVVDGRLVCRSEFESPEVDGEILAVVPDGVDPWLYVGKFVNVKIVAAERYDLFAVLV